VGETPKNYSIQVINPDDPDGLKIEAIIPHRLILHYYKYDPVRYENFRAVRHVLETPRRIFAGVRRFNEGGWCFTGKPTTWYVRPEVQVPFPNGLVFAVYLNPRFYVYEARAEKAADDDDCSPVDWRNRYTTLKWKSIS